MEQGPSLLCQNCQAHLLDEQPFLRPIDPILQHPNQLPSKEEISDMSKLLKEEMNELKWYEDRIAPLRQALEELETRKRALESQIRRRRSIISVQRKVPLEIWEKIFTIACCSPDDDRYFLTIHVDQQKCCTVSMTPVILSHVCPRWRDTVTRSTRLWASISVHLVSQYPRGGTKLLETFLRNSASCPLNLYILVDCERTASTQTSWEMLRRHLSRSQQLFIDFTSRCDAVPVKSLHDSESLTFDDLVFFHLTEKTGSPVNSEGEGRQSYFWQALCQAPKLTRLQLDGLHPRLHSLPFHQITTLAVDYLSFYQLETLLPMLEASPNLYTLRFGSFTQHIRPLSITPHRVEIASLRNLSIGSCYDDLGLQPVAINNIILEYLLASLVLPSLSTFEMTCFSISKITQAPLLLDMLNHSSSNLRCFSLILMSSDHEECPSLEPLSMLLNTVSHTTRLHLNTHHSRSLSWCNFIAPVLSELTDFSGNAIIILPHLTHISITGAGEVTPDTLTTVIALATARSRTRLSQSAVDLSHVCPLEELRVEDPKSSDIALEPQMVEAIQNLKRDGLRVLIEKPHRWYYE